MLANGLNPGTSTQSRALHVTRALTFVSGLPKLVFNDFSSCVEGSKLLFLYSVSLPPPARLVHPPSAWDAIVVKVPEGDDL